MHVEFLVEEQSAEAALKELVPKIQSGISFHIHAHQGKQDLLKKLPGKFRGYSRWIHADLGIVVLIDLDHDDCKKLKKKLDKMAKQAGLVTRATVRNSNRIQVLNRIAIEELESWFFGDIGALRAVFPRVSANLGNQKNYRDPDAVTGETFERLEQLLKKKGYFGGSGMPKIATARDIAKHMDPDRNRSRSFQVFRDGVREIAGTS